jgi:Zn finger protein HypA/HybF involved in hydrogenase expression
MKEKPKLGIVCPKCGGTRFETVRTEVLFEEIRRQKECEICGSLVVTVEASREVLAERYGMKA